MPHTIVETCTGCGACLKVCPTEAISGEKNILHIIDPHLCIDCHVCGWTCPYPSIYDQNGKLVPQIRPRSRPRAIVDVPQNCTACEKCIFICPVECISLVGDFAGASADRIVEVDRKICIGCELCELECPHDAIHILEPGFIKENEEQIASWAEWVAPWADGPFTIAEEEKEREKAEDSGETEPAAEPQEVSA